MNNAYPAIRDFGHHDLATAHILHLNTHDFLKTNSLWALDQPSKRTATFKASTSDPTERPLLGASTATRQFLTQVSEARSWK